MNRRIAVVVFFFCLLPGAVQAQKVKVYKATLQKWSGGVCCVHGTNYRFNLRINTGGRSLTADTLFLEDSGFPVTDQVLVKKECRSRYCLLDLAVNIRRGQPGRDRDELTADPPPLIPNPYGKPALVFRVGKKRVVYFFSNIQALESIAYP